MRSTFFRTFLVAALLLLLSFIVLGTSFAVFAYRFFIRERQDSLLDTALAISNQASRNVYSDTIIINRSFKNTVWSYAQLSDTYVIITNDIGRVIETSDEVSFSAIGANLYVGENIMRQIVLSGGYSGFGTLGGLLVSEYYSVGVPISSWNGNTVGTVFVSTSGENLREMIFDFIRIFITTAAAVMLLSLAWIFIAAQRLTRPLTLMSSAAKQFARGNFSVRVPETEKNDEIGKLSSSFNNMADALQQTEERRREFIANISHELKTPMTTIGGYVDGILDGVVPPEKQKQSLEIVSSEVKRLSRLVSQMLEMSRIESEQYTLNLKKFDLCETTRLVILGLEKRITDRNLDIEANFDDPVEVLAEQDSITRVIYNLVDNAVKYANEGTTIKISISRREKDKKVLFSITDEGKAIPPDEVDRIFERFHKTDRSRRSEGLGLGLYLTKNILRQHGEDIVCHCDGGTTTMSFTLPAAVN
jgi:signal transduction histidine kinase